MSLSHARGPRLHEVVLAAYLLAVSPSFAQGDSGCCFLCRESCEKGTVKLGNVAVPLCAPGETDRRSDYERVFGTVASGQAECYWTWIYSQRCVPLVCYCGTANGLHRRSCCTYMGWEDTDKHFLLDGREHGPTARNESIPTLRQCCAILAITQSCALDSHPFGLESVTFKVLLDQLGTRELARMKEEANSCGLEQAWQSCLDAAPVGNFFKKALETLN